MKGRTLEERLREGALPMHEVIRVVAHVGSALDALHGAGLVHRDVKPSNVMIDEAVRRCSRISGSPRAARTRSSREPGMVMGTLDYLAPELLRGQEATSATDLYALG